MWEGPALSSRPSASPLETMTLKNPVCQQDTMFSAHWIQDEGPFKSPPLQTKRQGNISSKPQLWLIT